MSVYKKVPGHETVNISTLEFDTKPTKGSLNPVTSDGISTQSDNIAEAFSASSTYAIGEVVIGPDGKLYQCTTAVDTAGEWDPEDWDETSLGDILFTSRGSSNIEVRKSHCKVGDAVYADGDGNVHFIAGKSVTAASIPEGWEFVGVVALREGTKATILNKNESNILFTNCWLFKVTGLTFPLTSPVSMVMQQGRTSGSTTVEVGTYTSSEGVTTLDDFVADFDDWLQDNPTASGALANYGWHAAKMKDADGNDSCFIIVDNINAQSRFSPVKSGDATAPMYMWEYAGFTSDVKTMKRKDGVDTQYCLSNKEQFKNYGSSVGSPTDSLTTTGIFNENGFNATTIVKNFYKTYDNYLDYMVPDTDATTGAYAFYKATGKQTSDKLNEVKYTPINGTEKNVFKAEAYAAEQRAHSTANVEGLNTGDWYIPDVNEMFKILYHFKLDGSDPVNSCFVLAGSSVHTISTPRVSSSRFVEFSYWFTSSGGGSFNSNAFSTNGRYAWFVASYDVGE